MAHKQVEVPYGSGARCAGCDSALVGRLSFDTEDGILCGSCSDGATIAKLRDWQRRAVRLLPHASCDISPAWGEANVAWRKERDALMEEARNR